MPKSMTKAQIIAHFASKFNLKKKLAAEILDEMASLALREARNTFTMPGIGKLVLVHRKARLGRNPATGEQINIPAKRVLKFRVALAAKNAIIGGTDSTGPTGPKKTFEAKSAVSTIIGRTDTTGPKIIANADPTEPEIEDRTDNTGAKKAAKRVKGKA